MPMVDIAGLRISGLSYKIGGQELFSDAELAIPRGEVVALLGPSGSGKTSLLRLIVGFDRPQRGRIIIESEDKTATSPEARKISMLFQHPASFPSKTIMENALAARRARRAPKTEINAATADIADMMEEFDLSRDKDKRVADLSGGEYQRAAIIRCLSNASESVLLLLDEPFKSTLNYTLRWQLMEWLRDWQKKKRITTLLVTHDFTEASFLAERVAVIDKYRKMIVSGDANTLFNRSPNIQVAEIVGATNKWELRKFNYKLPVLGLDLDLVSKGAEWCVCRPCHIGIDLKGAGFVVVSKTLLGPLVRCVMMSVANPEFKVTADVLPSTGETLRDKCAVKIDCEAVVLYDDRQQRIE
jgi:ABC-type Fe3+/spermidine/putrescine transport system ATPase subunit